MIELENEKSTPVHVCVVVQTEYDIDPATGSPINVVSKVIPQGNVKVAKKSKVTLESIAEQYPVVTLVKSYYKMNKVAAAAMGVLNENGEMTTTLVGNRIRMQLTYRVDPVTKITYPIIMRDDEEKLVGAQQVRDSLSVSCSGLANQMISQYGKFFHVKSEGNEKFDLYVLYGYNTLEDLLDAVGAEIPSELRTQKLVEVNDDEGALNENGDNGAGEEFIPEEVVNKPTTNPSEFKYDKSPSPEISGGFTGVDIIGDDELEGIDINEI